MARKKASSADLAKKYEISYPPDLMDSLFCVADSVHSQARMSLRIPLPGLHLTDDGKRELIKTVKKIINTDLSREQRQCILLYFSHLGLSTVGIGRRLHKHQTTVCQLINRGLIKIRLSLKERGCDI